MVHFGYSSGESARPEKLKVVYQIGTSVERLAPIVVEACDISRKANSKQFCLMQDDFGGLGFPEVFFQRPSDESTKWRIQVRILGCLFVNTLICVLNYGADERISTTFFQCLLLVNVLSCGIGCWRAYLFHLDQVFGILTPVHEVTVDLRMEPFVFAIQVCQLREMTT